MICQVHLAAACTSLTNNTNDSHRTEGYYGCLSGRALDQAASLSYCAEAAAAAATAAADIPHISGGPDGQLWQCNVCVQGGDWVTDTHAPILKAHQERVVCQQVQLPGLGVAAAEGCEEVLQMHGTDLQAMTSLEAAAVSARTRTMQLCNICTVDRDNNVSLMLQIYLSLCYAS